MTPARRGVPILVSCLTALLGLAACFRGSLPPREFYRLEPADSLFAHANGARGAPLPGTLAVLEYATQGIYAERNIVYRVEDGAYGVYPSREWALPLGEMLGMLTTRALTGSPLTVGGSVFDPPTRRTHALLWRGVVREFDEVGRGQAVFAVVQLDAQLIRSADDSVLWSGSQRAEVAVSRPTMAGVIDGLSTAAMIVISRLVAGAQRALHPPSADSAHAPRS